MVAPVAGLCLSCSIHSTVLALISVFFRVSSFPSVYWNVVRSESFLVLISSRISILFRLT
jgi:hypothetical protein